MLSLSVCFVCCDRVFVCCIVCVVCGVLCFVCFGVNVRRAEEEKLRNGSVDYVLVILGEGKHGLFEINVKRYLSTLDCTCMGQGLPI